MDSVLNGLPEVQAYLDDVLVAEKGNDGGKDLKAVLQRFLEYDVKLRTDKCTFRMPEASYLGHNISTGGLQPLEKNMDAIMMAPTPKNEDQENKLNLGTLVWARNFGEGERWLPATVKETRGSRMITVEKAEVLCRRNLCKINQLVYRRYQKRLNQLCFVDGPVYGNPYSGTHLKAGRVLQSENYNEDRENRVRRGSRPTSSHVPERLENV
ncbi:uncharacterized protein [Dermacentor andersoni]|uniref:uncharacterized protein n=1 Tax=Dermacentor andersoni TaxID=34620 RepID=UPI003B39FE86